MDSVFSSQGSLLMSFQTRLRRAQYLVRKKLHQFKQIHWLLKVPAIGVIVLYAILIPTIILADKIKVVINFALILALLACVFVLGRCTGLQDGVVIGMTEGIDRAQKWQSIQEVGSREEQLATEGYLLDRQSRIASDHPVLVQQVVGTFDNKIQEWSRNRNTNR